MCVCSLSIFFFNDTATTEIYTLSLHDALPICLRQRRRAGQAEGRHRCAFPREPPGVALAGEVDDGQCQEGQEPRSEEHTSELQSRQYLVCRLLLEKKKKSKCT